MYVIESQSVMNGDFKGYLCLACSFFPLPSIYLTGGGGVAKVSTYFTSQMSLVSSSSLKL